MTSKQDIENLVRQLGELLVRQQRYVCTAESCTGGGIASVITDQAGSSAWFDRAYVTYSNQAKVTMLGVEPSTLDKFGAVSEQVAREMAAGALRESGVDLAVAVTGVAGPGGGTKDKPVGMVCFGWSDGTQLKTSTEQFPGGRAEVRAASVRFALQRLLELAEIRP